MPRASAALDPPPVKAFFRVVTSEEARRQLAAFAPRTKSEQLPVLDACGRTLAKPLTSPVDLPHFNRTNMDGYAVRAQDTFGASASLPAYLKLVGSIEMGAEAKRRLKKGETMRIATGGMLPPGANSMVMVEYTEELGDGTVEILRSVSPWESILRVGEDIKKKKPIFPAGRRLRAHDIGALTGVGITKVLVYKRPTVALISTGDEIIPPSRSPRPGQIRNVNQYSLHAMITECGGTVTDLGVVKDDSQAFTQALSTALKAADVVMVSGGSSVGIKDMALDVICSFPRSELFFHGISIAPGKPTIFARAAGKPVMGLPGHPVSALVVFCPLWCAAGADDRGRVRGYGLCAVAHDPRPAGPKYCLRPRTGGLCPGQAAKRLSKWRARLANRPAAPREIRCDFQPGAGRRHGLHSP